MANNIVRLPVDYFPDPVRNRPVFNGSVFVGEPDLDPEILANRKTVTLRQENGTEVEILPGAQPLSTGQGGVITYNGSSAEVLTNGNYSIKVLSSTGAQVYYFANVEDGTPALLNQVVLKLDTLADAVSSTDLYDGASVDIKERASGVGGGAVWDAVLSSTVTENGLNIVQCTGVPTLSLVLRVGSVVNTIEFGCVPGSDSTAALQNAANYAIANNKGLEVDSNSTSFETIISTEISLSASLHIFAATGKKATILCNNCDGFDFAAGVIRSKIENIGISQSVRHTTTPNSFFAIRYQGSTGSRPFWNTLESLFIDGFQTPIDGSYLWEQNVTDVKTVFCGKGINLTGICANNKIYENSFSGNGLIFDFGDGTNTIEGIDIHNNLIDCLSLGQVIDALGCSYCNFQNNICDFVGPGTGILIRSSGSLPSIGWDVTGNYVAFNANAGEGIRLLNSLAPSIRTGHTIDNNTIFTYGAVTLSYGILSDGSQEENNKITNNTIEATALADFENSSAVDTTCTGNTFLGPGVNTTTNIEYDNNKGSLIGGTDGRVFRTFGGRQESWSAVQPTSGTYTVGDKVWRQVPTINAESLVLMGWVRLTTGSGHVFGTDWANMYVSHVSPAT